MRLAAESRTSAFTHPERAQYLSTIVWWVEVDNLSCKRIEFAHDLSSTKRMTPSEASKPNSLSASLLSCSFTLSPTGFC